MSFKDTVIFNTPDDGLLTNLEYNWWNENWQSKLKDSQIEHELTRDQNMAAAIGGQRLTILPMAQTEMLVLWIFQTNGSQCFKIDSLVKWGSDLEAVTLSVLYCRVCPIQANISSLIYLYIKINSLCVFEIEKTSTFTVKHCNNNCA